MDQIVTVKQVILQGLFSNYLSRCFFHDVSFRGKRLFELKRITQRTVCPLRNMAPQPAALF